MMGSGQKRGWVIIGMDLLIVLGIYFIYSNFAFDNPSVNTESFKGKFKYELEVHQPAGDTIPVVVSVQNQRNESVTTRLPNGLLVLLTDGADRKFWSSLPVRETSLALSAGERRSWRLTPAHPSDAPASLYVEVYVDRDRQMRARVPSE